MSGGGGEEAAAAAAAAATSSSSSGKKRMSNIESLLVHTMPLVRCVSSRTKSGKKKKKKDFALKELWRAFHETSAFGCEVPLEMQRRSGRRKDCEEEEEGEEENVEVIAQYYASYISAFQIFEKTTKKKGKKKKKKRGSSRGRNKASAQYFESLAPYSRPPLTDVIERLAEENEKVQSLKASEIDREKSWFCFAWYPIYRIPQGTSRTDIQGCFLTYHGLNHLDIEDEEDEEEEDGDDSDGEEEEEEEEEEEDDEEATDKDEAGDKNGTTPIRGLPPPPPASLTLSGETRLQRRIEDAKKSVAVLEEDGKGTAATTATAKEGKEEGKEEEEEEEEEEEHAFIPLKPFGLCCYKTDPEIWEESDEAENARTAAMIDGAYAFLRSIEVIHPDYEFFSHHG